MIWGVYCGTYIAANTINAVCLHNDIAPEYPRFVVVSCCNIILCLMKDRQFTKMFGIKAPSAVPPLTYLCFMTRDSLTIGASFNLPDPFSDFLQNNAGITKGNSDTLA
jgi:hypothetical protein